MSENVFSFNQVNNTFAGQTPGDDVYGQIINANNAGGTSPRQQGMFGLYPLATPKYAINKGVRDAEFKESMARIYVSLADTSEQVKAAYLQSLPGDAATQSLARVLIGPDPGKGIQTGFIDFLLGQVQETFTEKMQVDEVLADNYVAFFFGQNAPLFNYSGTLLNSWQDDQRSGFMLAYQTLLRGTALARGGALARLRYDSVIVSGVMTSHTQVINAENEMAVPFTFSFLVKEYLIRINPQWSKQTVQDYVKLSTAFATDALLSKVGNATDQRIRTTMVLPTNLSDESVAGTQQDTTVVDSSQPAPQQLAQKTSQIAAPPAATGDIYGTVDTTSNPPPGAYVVGF